MNDHAGNERTVVLIRAETNIGMPITPGKNAEFLLPRDCFIFHRTGEGIFAATNNCTVCGQQVSCPGAAVLAGDEEPILATECDGALLALSSVVVEWEPAIGDGAVRARAECHARPLRREALLPVCERLAKGAVVPGCNTARLRKT